MPSSFLEPRAVWCHVPTVDKKRFLAPVRLRHLLAGKSLPPWVHVVLLGRLDQIRPASDSGSDTVMAGEDSSAVAVNFATGVYPSSLSAPPFHLGGAA